MELVAAGGLVERLRAVKDAGELRRDARPRPRWPTAPTSASASAAWPGAASARWPSSGSVHGGRGRRGPVVPGDRGRGPRTARCPHAVPRDAEIPPTRWWWSTWARSSTATARTARARSPPARSRTRRAGGLRARARGPGGGARDAVRAGAACRRGRRRGPRPDRGAPATASASATGSATAWGSRCTRGRAWRGRRRASCEAGNAVTVEPGRVPAGPLRRAHRGPRGGDRGRLREPDRHSRRSS